jgi:hypothetical protein
MAESLSLASLAGAAILGLVVLQAVRKFFTAPVRCLFPFSRALILTFGTMLVPARRHPQRRHSQLSVWLLCRRVELYQEWTSYNGGRVSPGLDCGSRCRTRTASNASQYPGKAFKVALANRWLVLVHGRTLIEDVRNAPDEFLSVAEATNSVRKYLYFFKS